MLKRLFVLSGLFLLPSILAETTPNDPSNSGRRLSVLIVTTPLAGHAYPLLALGEELVRRGHNVTFCTARNWIDFEKKATDRGMNFLSTGEFYFDEKSMKDAMSGVSNDTTPIIFKFQSKMNHLKLVIESTVKFIHRSVDLRQWDIIAVNIFLGQTIPCLAHEAGVPVVEVIQRALRPHLLPDWPFPTEFTLQTDDLTFLQRMGSFFAQNFVRVGFYLFDPVRLSSTDPVCDAVFHTRNPECVEFPCFSLSPIGFEYPRTTLPLMHSVGSILTKPKTSDFSQDLSKWLSSKADKSVIYVSMGTMASQTVELARAIVNGLKPTGYSVVWSLKLQDRHVLNELDIDSSIFFISDWLPQFQLLQHKSIAMAILHGGAGGVVESLYNGVPIVVIPFFGDQVGSAARVQAAGAGVYLHLSGISAAAVRESVERIRNGEYRKEAAKMRKIFLHAGGVDKASDLMELYADIGYQHLVPAYAKYKWSWIQYYNVDVRLVLCLLLGGVVYCVTKLCKCCCRCRSRNNKTKKD